MTSPAEKRTRALSLSLSLSRARALALSVMRLVLACLLLLERWVDIGAAAAIVAVLTEEAPPSQLRHRQGVPPVGATLATLARRCLYRVLE